MKQQKCEFIPDQLGILHATRGERRLYKLVHVLGGADNLLTFRLLALSLDLFLIQSQVVRLCGTQHCKRAPNARRQPQHNLRSSDNSNMARLTVKAAIQQGSKGREPKSLWLQTTCQRGVQVQLQALRKGA